MSFSRAFSLNRNQHEMQNNSFTFPSRAATHRNGKSINRTQISSPMELISTSNAHVQTAYAIAGTVPIGIRKISTTLSVDTSSSDESDASTSSVVSNSTLTDASSVDDSPTSTEPETKRLSFFKPNIVDIKRSSQILLESIDPDATPKIPQRAPLHSKSAHESLHRQRSQQRMLRSEGSRGSFDIGGPHRSRTTPPGTAKERMSPDRIVESPTESPFDDELAELHEVARDYASPMRSPEEDADVMHMEKHGLASFCAADYMYEIQSLVHGLFADERPYFMHMGGFF